MLKHVVARPLLELSELAALDVLCAFSVHKNGLLVLHLVQLLLLSDQALTEPYFLLLIRILALVAIRVRGLIGRIFIHEFKFKRRLWNVFFCCNGDLLGGRLLGCVQSLDKFRHKH